MRAIADDFEDNAFRGLLQARLIAVVMIFEFGNLKVKCNRNIGNARFELDDARIAQLVGSNGVGPAVAGWQVALGGLRLIDGEGSQGNVIKGCSTGFVGREGLRPSGGGLRDAGKLGAGERGPRLGSGTRCSVKLYDA